MLINVFNAVSYTIEYRASNVCTCVFAALVTMDIRTDQ